MANTKFWTQDEIANKVFDEASNTVRAQINGRNAADLATRGAESTIYVRNGSLAANTEEIVADVSGREVHLEALTFGTNSKGNAEIIIVPYRASGSLATQKLVIASASGLYIEPVTVSMLLQLQNGENDFFKVQVNDDTKLQYSLIMKRQARFGNGVRISVKNRDTADAINVACTIMLYSQRA